MWTSTLDTLLGTTAHGTTVLGATIHGTTLIATDSIILGSVSGTLGSTAAGTTAGMTHGTIAAGTTGTTDTIGTTAAGTTLGITLGTTPDGTGTAGDTTMDPVLADLMSSDGAAGLEEPAEISAAVLSQDPAESAHRRQEFTPPGQAARQQAHLQQERHPEAL